MVMGAHELFAQVQSTYMEFTTKNQCLGLRSCHCGRLGILLDWHVGITEVDSGVQTMFYTNGGYVIAIMH